MNWEPLIAAALAVRDRAYCPYSHFAVGAALATEGGDVFAGCNVENRSYGLSICAERSAVVQAVSADRRRFLGIAVATGTSPPSRPCGMCLDTLAEFAPSLPILLINPQGEREELRLDELLTQPFVLKE